jgi:ankyrin repeat protein
MLAICESKQKQDLLTVLNEMPRGLRGTYDEVLTRIQRQRPADAKLAERTFQWLLYAYQTFDAKSMSVALSINPEKDTTNQPSVEVILDCCKNLVVLDKELGILRLIHATTRMYLRERFDKEVAHRYLTITCLQHLNATLLSINFDDIPNPEKHWDSFAEKELCRYTAISWPKHRNELPQSDLTILQLELSLLFSEKHYKQWLSVLTKVKLDSISVNYDSQLAAEPSRSYNYTRGLFWDELIWLGIIESPEVHIDPLCAAIHFQLHHVVDLILNNAAMAHSILGNNERCLTALHFAAETGDVAMAKKMILAVATRHAVRKHSMVRVASPLSLASFSNQTEMVKFLLQEPSLVTAREPKACQWNALTASLYYDISRVAEILATSSVYDFKFPDNQGNIPIELAALLGNHDIFKLLLQRYNGSLPRNIVCSCLGSAIQGESKARSDIVRDLLLSYGTSSIVSFDLLLSVFDWPSIASFADLTQVLVSCIAGVHAQLHNQTKSKISFRHILDHKTQHKQLDLEHRELGHLLLQILQRANVQLAKQVVAAINPKCFHHEIGSEGNTVFHYAVRYESVELLNVLLKSQTGYLTQENRYGLTPLMEAFATRNEELILQFLQFTRVSATQRFGHQSLLGYAQRHNLKRVVEKLQHLCAGVSEWPTEEVCSINNMFLEVCTFC